MRQKRPESCCNDISYDEDRRKWVFMTNFYATSFSTFITLLVSLCGKTFARVFIHSFHSLVTFTHFWQRIALLLSPSDRGEREVLFGPFRLPIKFRSRVKAEALWIGAGEGAAILHNFYCLYYDRDRETEEDGSGKGRGRSENWLQNQCSKTFSRVEVENVTS